MLKLAGKQRYGTQFTCAAGRWAPSPLEDEAAVEALRRTVELDPLADNLARMTRSYGSCSG